MIFPKYLISMGVLLLAGWSPTFAASNADSTQDTSAPLTDVPKDHHKKRHSTKAAATSTNAPTAGGTASDTSATTAKNSPGSKNKAPSTTTNQTASTSTPSTNLTGATVGATKATTTVAKGKGTKKKHGAGSQTAAVPPAGTEVTGVPLTQSSEKSKGTTAGAGVGTNSAPITGEPPAVGAAAAASTAVNTPSGVAATGKGKHRRHGTATNVLPQPPIVVDPASAAPFPTTPAITPASGQGPAAGGAITAGSGIPTIETGPPVARQGAGSTATLAIVQPPTAQPVPHFNFNDYPTHKRATQTYPWKTGIVTTVFWIGEGSTPISAMTNLKSAWDGNWVHNNGGADDQYDMSGYGSGSHASTLNPFYIALPFNDLAYPDKSSRWLPDNWSRYQRRGDKPVSACQHRWIEIKNRAGRVCFAQWEDVGPIVTDDAEYVFGSSRPSASRGLDVSPAVAKYLGIDSTAVTSWRFVEDEDVLPGMWLRYDEQALLFRAMKEKLRGGGTNTRIQQLEEPTPDDSDNDANQRKVGAARG